MKVLVDTSAWVDFLNGYASRECSALRFLLQEEHDLCTCGIIVSEVFQGLRRDKSRPKVEKLFKELTFLEPSGLPLYLRAAEIFRLLRKKGKTIRSTIDCIIVAIAEENDSYVLARDSDMEIIIGSGLVEVALWTLEPPNA
jgi:predicted nucleic acid-binding protein